MVHLYFAWQCFFPLFGCGLWTLCAISNIFLPITPPFPFVSKNAQLDSFIYAQQMSGVWCGFEGGEKDKDKLDGFNGGPQLIS